MKYVVVTFPNATTPFHDYVYPEKFKDYLPLTYYYQGFGIYEVPLPQPALVQLATAQAAKSLQVITDAQDRRPLSDYLNLIDSPPIGPHVTYTRPNMDQLTISVSNASSNTAILVKVTFDQRWNAEINHQSIPISQIGPDFMILYPETNGDYQITLHLENSQGELVGYFITSATIIGVPAILVVQSLRSRRRKSAEE